MRKVEFSMLLMMIIISLMVSGCGSSQAADVPVEADVTSDTDDEAENVTVQPDDEEVPAFDALIEGLQAVGAEVEIGEGIEQPFLNVSGQIIRVNGVDVQVFEYPDRAAADADAALIAPDVSTVGTTFVTWVDVPHFYQQDNLIVLYVGQDDSTMVLLENQLGQPIAQGSSGSGLPGLDSVGGGDEMPTGGIDGLIVALNGHDWEALKGMMADRFVVGYWQSEGVFMSPDEAITFLQEMYPEGALLVFEKDQAQFPELEGMPLTGFTPPEVETSGFVYSTGWGEDGQGEAILIMATGEDGQPYWYGMVYAMQGF